MPLGNLIPDPTQGTQMPMLGDLRQPPQNAPGPISMPTMGDMPPLTENALQGAQLRPLVHNPQQDRMNFLEQDLQRREMPHPSEPGFWHKLGHIMATAGNIAGNVLDPELMAMFPQTQLGSQVRAGLERKELGGLQEQQLEERKEFDKETQEQAEQPLRSAQTREANAKADELENPPAPNLEHLDTDQGMFALNPKTKELTPLTYNGQPLKKPTTEKTPNTKEQLQQQLVEAENKGDTETAAKLTKQLKDIDPLGQQKLSVTVRGQDLAQNRAETGYSRQDVRDHDKNYVVPAEAVDKSFRMADRAYQEYEDARKQGKELPTGAQSMLELATHLSTTFGNVKGARVTKDMIQEHMHARSIPDSAVVAIQRLTNGDRLSPDQWTAFHDLISQSRQESWSTAVKEAARKKIPIDFLPKDLQHIDRNGTGYDMGDDGQYHRSQ